MLTKMIETLKKNPRTIVYTEGTDKRILESAHRLTQEGILGVVLLGKPEEVKAAAKAGNFNIDACQIIDPENYEGIDAMVAEMVKLRKGKMTYSTADTVRPALQLIKTKPGNNIVSSCFILVRGDEKIAMGDCAINIDPSEDDLVEIAIESAKTAKIFGIDPKVAMLSYSTLGSGKGPSVTKVANATKKIKEAAPELAVEGEIQFDASVSPEVAEVKCPGSPVAGQANTFIFPDINAANIGYKIASRLGGYTAVGPVLQGLNAPINDLSRGCNAEEVYSMSIVTAALSVPEEEKVDEEGLEAIVRAVVETMLAAKKLDK